MPKLTKTFVDNTTPPDSGYCIHWDGNEDDPKHVPVKGYGLRISAGGRKTFVAMGRVRNRAVMYRIGQYGHLTETEARKKAMSVLQGMRDGVDPRDTRREEELASLTLQQVADEYMAHPGRLKASTIKEFQRHIDVSLGWGDRKVVAITEDDCRKRYRQIRMHGSRGHRKGGAPRQATRAFSILRCLMNFAMRRYKKADGTPLILNNPVSGLQDEWVPDKVRTTYIPVDRIGHVWNYLTTTRAVAHDRVSQSGLDLAMFLLLTGARIREASELTWDRVGGLDTDEPWWHIGEANSKTGKELWLPLSTQAAELLDSRPRLSDNNFVFPGKVRGTCVKDPRALWRRISTIADERTRAHDCRRSFTTYGVAHCGLDLYKVELLTSHVPKSTTMKHYLETRKLGYLRPEVQAIADFIELKAEQAAGSNVVALPAK
jgi:integrase